MNTWIDYTRRNDPSCIEGVEVLNNKLRHIRKYPDVFCFWTKNPHGISVLYSDIIKFFKQKNILVLCIATVNPGYQPLLEPGIKESFWDLTDLIKILGGPAFVRLRFDPVIKSFTTIPMFKKTCDIAKNFGIKNIITNFFVPEYKDTWKTVQNVLHDNFRKFTKEEKSDFLKQMIREAEQYGITLHSCAEIAKLTADVTELKSASCSDPLWPEELGYDFKFKLRPSRPGCGCCYSNDWGIYRSAEGGYKCPNGCIYCYAK